MTKYNMQLDVTFSSVTVTVDGKKITLSITESDSISRPDLQMMGVSYHKSPPPIPRRRKNTSKPKNKKKWKRHQHKALNADMTPTVKDPVLEFPAPPPIKRSYHFHETVLHGEPVYQVMESNINRGYQQDQPDSVYQELDEIHLNVRNWNHDVNQQHQHTHFYGEDNYIYDEIPALEEDDIDWENEESGSEEDMPSKERLCRQMEDLGIESWSEDDDDESDTKKNTQQTPTIEATTNSHETSGG